MTIELIAHSVWGPHLGRGIARWLPRGTAYRLADGLADLVAARRRSVQVKAVRQNLATVRGREESDSRLEKDVRNVFRNAARGYVDLFRAMARGPHALAEACIWDPSLERGLKAAQDRGNGVILIAPHTCGFDIGMLTLAEHGLSVQALSIARPKGSYRSQNQLRERYGLEVTPIAIGSLRAAVRRLRAGGMVLTGVDRPLGEGLPLTFFGRRAVLPVGHVRLAQETGAALVFAASRILDRGRYLAFGGEVLLTEDGAAKEGVRVLAQAVVDRMEAVITERPDEWLMFFPVWK